MIEELIQEEIVDETDVYVDIKKQIQVARAKAKRKSTPSPNVSTCIGNEMYTQRSGHSIVFLTVQGRSSTS